MQVKLHFTCFFAGIALALIEDRDAGVTKLFGYRFKVFNFPTVFYFGAMVLFSASSFATPLGTKQPSWALAFPDLAQRYNTESSPAIENHEATPIVELHNLNESQGQSAFVKNWKNLNYAEREKRVVTFCNDRKHIPGRWSNDSESLTIAMWIMAHFKTQKNFYVKHRFSLERVSAIRVQVNDISYFNELKEKEKVNQLTEEESSFLDEFYWNQNKIKAVTRYIEKNGWWPNKNNLGIVGTMGKFAFNSDIGGGGGGGPKILFWKLSLTAQKILLSHGFVTEGRKHSRPCAEKIQAFVEAVEIQKNQLNLKVRFRR